MLTARDKIIIADDVAINRELLRDIFEDRCELLEAADGEETLALVRANPDACLLLLDLVMPKLNGLQVLERMS